MKTKRIKQWARIAYLVSFGMTSTQSSRAAEIIFGLIQESDRVTQLIDRKRRALKARGRGR